MSTSGGSSLWTGPYGTTAATGSTWSTAPWSTSATEAKGSSTKRCGQPAIIGLSRKMLTSLDVGDFAVAERAALMTQLEHPNVMRQRDVFLDLR